MTLNMNFELSILLETTKVNLALPSVRSFKISFFGVMGLKKYLLFALKAQKFCMFTLWCCRLPYLMQQIITRIIVELEKRLVLCYRIMVLYLKRYKKNHKCFYIPSLSAGKEWNFKSLCNLKIQLFDLIKLNRNFSCVAKIWKQRKRICQNVLLVLDSVVKRYGIRYEIYIWQELTFLLRLAFLSG